MNLFKFILTAIALVSVNVIYSFKFSSNSINSVKNIN